MGAELRWILLGLSLPLLIGIWWWTARRAGRIPGNSELREPTPSADIPRHADSGDGLPPETESEAQPRDWGVPPFEPLNIRTADFDHIPVLDDPMMVSTEPVPSPAPVRAAAPEPAPIAGPMRATAPPVPTPGSIRATAPARASTPPPPMRPMFTTGPVSEPGDGAAAPAPQAHADGRSLFCVASLIEPGTFDVAEMADQEYRGVTLFAVLPGPILPLDTMDELLGTARGLAEELSGMVQDSKGMPLSPQRAAALREDIARFQASLPGT